MPQIEGPYASRSPSNSEEKTARRSPSPFPPSSPTNLTYPVMGNKSHTTPSPPPDRQCTSSLPHSNDSRGKRQGKATPSPPLAYNVYRAEYSGGPLNHVAIFVETEESGTGTGFIYHVEGTILMGMAYRPKSALRPEDDGSYVIGSKHSLGTVLVDDYQRVDEICSTIPPPAVQVDKRGRRLDPSKPLRRCGEWVDEAITELRRQDVLRQ